jgi:hypothetical protein
VEDKLEVFDEHYTENLNNIEAYTLELTLMKEFGNMIQGE